MCVSTKKSRAVKGLSEHKSFLVFSANGQVESLHLFHFIKTVLVQGRHRVTCWAGVTFGGSKSGSHFVFQIK